MKYFHDLHHLTDSVYFLIWSGFFIFPSKTH